VLSILSAKLQNPVRTISSVVINTLIPSSFSYHGVLPNLLRSVIKDIEKESKAEIQVYDQLFDLLKNIATTQLGSKLMQECGILSEMLPLLELKTPGAEKITARYLSLIEALVRTNKQLAQQLTQMGVFSYTIDLLQSCMEKCKAQIEKLKEPKKIQDFVDPSTYNLMRNSL